MDIERLFNRHKDEVYMQLMRRCGHIEDAEDALSEAIYLAVKSLDQLENQDRFHAWLAKIGTRAHLRMRMREQVFRSTSMTELEARGIEFQSADLGPIETAELKALKDQVSEAIQMLPDLYRDVYIRREVLGDEAESVVAELNISLPACKSRLRRARDLMRDQLDPDHQIRGRQPSTISLRVAA